jgi:biotin carboxyl carrier protein
MIKKLRVTVDGKPYEVTVELPDEPVEGLAAPAHAPAPVASVSSAAIVPAPVSAAALTAKASGPGEVPSPLSGRVAAIAVQVGQSVKEGEQLLTLEAMKMNTLVFAPRAGKVAEIKATVGAAVEEGQLLVRLE